MAKMWGGRFTKKTDLLVEKFTSSINSDKALARFDVLGSIAHAQMLGRCGIIPKAKTKKIVKALRAILNEIESGRFKIDLNSEDIHTNIQNELEKRIGRSASFLHTARSRNDQVSLDMRMYLKEEIDAVIERIRTFQASLVLCAKKSLDIIIPGFTHLQHAQPVLFSHYLLAYCEMLERDRERLLDLKRRIDVLPSGSLALSGTSLPIDREFLAKRLEFLKISQNSIDAVSDRDFVIETISALSIMAMHLSRLSEDFILWASPEFGIIEIDERFCTGSSLMPQKKNPDLLELVRASCGEIFGALVSVLTLMKGLPLTYNRDMQMDKEPIFRAVRLVKDSLEIVIRVLKGIEINRYRSGLLLKDELLYATDILEYLVKKGVPFKEAHNTVGKIVVFAQEKDLRLSEVPLERLKIFDNRFERDVYELFNAKKSVSLKDSIGGTSPRQVRLQIRNWEKRLARV